MLTVILVLSQWWPQFGVNPQSTGVQALKGAMDTAVVKWRVKVYADAVAGEGAAIADVDGDGKGEIFFGDAGGPYLYRVDDGSITWAKATDGSAYPCPVVADVDGGQPEVTFLDLGSLKIVNPATGSALYTVDFGNGWEWSAHAADADGDGKVEVFAEDLGGNVVRIDGDSVTWRVTLPGGMASSGVSLGDANGDGVPDAFASDQQGNLCGIDGATGNIMWTYSTGIWFGSTHPAVWDVNKDGQLEAIFVYKNTVYCLNAATGALLWSFPLDNETYVDNAVVVDGDRDGSWEIYVASETSVYCLTPGGAQKWRFSMPGDAWAWGLAAADIDGDGAWELLCSTDSSLLLVLNAASGSLEWSYNFYPNQVGDANVALYQPTVGDVDGDGCSEVVVGTEFDSLLFVLDDPYGATGCGQSLLVGGGRGSEGGFRAWTEPGVIFANLPAPGRLTLELYDRAGRLEKSFSMTLGAGLHSFKPRLSPGVYFVRLHFKGGVKTLRLLIK